MWRLRVLVSRICGQFAAQDPDSELNREIEEHLHSLTERFIRQGMSPDAAEHAARSSSAALPKFSKMIARRAEYRF
jgi:hypothetical protein